MFTNPMMNTESLSQLQEQSLGLVKSMVQRSNESSRAIQQSLQKIQEENFNVVSKVVDQLSQSSQAYQDSLSSLQQNMPQSVQQIFDPSQAQQMFNQLAETSYQTMKTSIKEGYSLASKMQDYALKVQGDALQRFNQVSGQSGQQGQQGQQGH